LSCLAVKAQTVIEILDNPAELSPGTTNAVLYVFPRGTFPDDFKRGVFLYAPSTNASTVQFNFMRNSFTLSPALAGNNDKIFYSEVKNGSGFYFKAVNPADKIIVFW